MGKKGMNRRQFLKLTGAGSLVAAAGAVGGGMVLPKGLWAATPKIATRFIRFSIGRILARLRRLRHPVSRSPFQTVRASFPHTAFRRSSRCRFRGVAHSTAQTIQTHFRVQTFAGPRIRPVP